MRRSLVLSLVLLAASALRADTKLLYDFESDTQGWAGKTSVGTKGATSGTHAMTLDAKGSVGWNQSLALLQQNEDWSNAIELQVDVTVPPGSCGSAEFIEFIPVFSGPANSWYALTKTKLNDGLNKISVPLDGSKIATPTKFYLVLNTGKPIPGDIYVDNIRMHTPGKPGSLKIHVKDERGMPVQGAVVAAGKEAVRSDGQGLATLNGSSDSYPSEVLGDGILGTKFTAVIPAGSTGEQSVTVKRLARPAPKAAHVWVMAEKPGIAFDAHRIYGHNQDMWNGLDPFTNPEALKKLKAIRAEMIRIPGGGYANQWDWRTGAIKKQDGTMALDWTPEATWPVWKKWFKDLGPQSEALMILNVFQSTPADQVAWVKDAIDSGIKVRYVELGNEPDLDPNIVVNGVKGLSTHVDKYVELVTPYAQAIRKAFPDIKILGPCPAQIVHKECPDKSPWLCQKDENEYWIQKFLRLFSKKGDLLDGISFHSYPFWPGDPAVWNAEAAFETPKLLPEYMPKWRGWIKQYYPAKASSFEVAMTEYNVQVPENATTADLEDGVWHAAFLAEFIKQGGTVASAWDINTCKVGDGGGHGMLDPANDPTRPYAERAKYWTFKMLANNFTGTLVPAQTNNPKVMAYAAKDRGRVSVLVVNSDPEAPATVTVQVSGAPNATKMRTMRLSRKEYVWSKVLYRAVVNEDPTQKQASFAAPAAKGGWRAFAPTVEPMSVNLYILE